MIHFEKTLEGKRIFVTGHSGFTGSWLCAWFSSIGSNICGYSLEPETQPALWPLLGLSDRVASVTGDIMDQGKLQQAMATHQPDVVIHLAAQPLVRRSYSKPLHTFAVNALGTANVLEAARQTASVRGVVCITTDKVYENREWVWGYRENDPLGGKDPYSASKSAAEMIIKGYATLLDAEKRNLPIAIARGGNIIGGGDWSEDRLIPDFVRAVSRGEELVLRFPEATRPWQHVLALVHGYGILAAGLLSDDAQRYAGAWNLGPTEVREYSVRTVMEILAAHWQAPILRYLDAPLPEARALALDSRSAIHHLGWSIPWSVEEMVARTAAWYRAYAELPANCPMQGAMRDFTLQQIEGWRVAQAKSGTAD